MGCSYSSSWPWESWYRAAKNHRTGKWSPPTWTFCCVSVVSIYVASSRPFYPNVVPTQKRDPFPCFIAVENNTDALISQLMASNARHSDPQRVLEELEREKKEMEEQLTIKAGEAGKLRAQEVKSRWHRHSSFTRPWSLWVCYDSHCRGNATIDGGRDASRASQATIWGWQASRDQ